MSAFAGLIRVHPGPPGPWAPLNTVDGLTIFMRRDPAGLPEYTVSPEGTTPGDLPRNRYLLENIAVGARKRIKGGSQSL